MDRLRPDDPDTIGPYRLIARLGSGGMGVVFLGTKDTERVAIKVVRHSFLDDPSLRIRFEREIDTLRKVSSPHVAAMVDSSTEGDFAWHAVEFVNGPTLRERIHSKGPLPEDQWWALARQLADALASVHELGIVHRDIKPANIIMSETGPKLIDFGISQDSDATSLTMTGLVAGSPAWLSPEQLEGTPVTAGSDLYSLGSVLVFAATGKSPWGDETSMSVPVVYQKILSGETSFEGLTAKQRELIEALHDPSPEKRRFVSLDSNPSPTAGHPESTTRPSGGSSRNAPLSATKVSLAPGGASAQTTNAWAAPAPAPPASLSRDEWAIIAETELWSTTDWRMVEPIAVLSLESINPAYWQSLEPFDKQEAQAVFSSLGLQAKLLWHVCGQPDLTLFLGRVPFEQWLSIINPEPVAAWQQAGQPHLSSWRGPFGEWLVASR